MAGGPVDVVGRQSELEQLARWLGRAEDGLQACVLTGAAGMGKTTIWRRGVALAEQAGVRVLTASPAGSEARLSYAGLADLLEMVEAERFASLPGVQRRALDVALLLADADERGVDARAVGSGLRSLLRDLGEAAPVLVAVDDAQWLDGATSAALAFALRRLEAARVGVLASVRTQDGALPQTFVASVSAKRRHEIALAPLSVGSIHAIVRRELGWAPPRPTLVRVASACEGNPFYALEIVRELKRLGEPAPVEGLPIPADLRALVRSRLDRLPVETGEALLAAACLGAPNATLVGADALGAAEQAGVVQVAGDGRVTFAHPLFASAILDSASTAHRQAVHRRLAELVREPEERVRHLALAASGPDATVAGELDTAARLARSRGAATTAAELAELALRLTPEDDPGRPGRLLAAAALHFGAGDLARAQTLLEQVLDEGRDGSLGARALRLLGLLQVRQNGYADAVRLALAALAAAEDEELRAEIELDLAVYRAWSDDYAGGDAHAQAAVAHAEQAGNDGLLANALAVATIVACLCGRGVMEPDLQRALALEDARRETPLLQRPRFALGFLRLCEGRAAEALAALDELRVDALAQGQESDVPLLFVYLVWASVWSGDLERADGLAEEARQAAALLDDRLVDALALSASAVASAYAGDADRARRDSTLAVEQFERARWWIGTIWPRWARGVVELSLGNAAAAHEALAPLSDLIAALGPTDPSLSLFVPDVVEALTELGRADEAGTLLQPFEQRALGLDRGWALAAAARARASIEAARGNLEAARTALEDALRRYDAEQMPLERARALLELGRLERRRKQKKSARQALEEALAVFESVGAALWAERARTELARVATRTASAGLTPTEEQIARLAAEGLSNRAIAEQAFVSVKTVETNLKRAYRKLGISSRAQLARALDRRDAEAIS